ncbi:MAG: helix-turn-helix transcriptional regulator [Oscillospiraceae bacterium]|nr:helix-turn-helix transcriptional regulator [Oscillospiraceae bacterium]
MKERIKKLRKALDLTQQEFADRLGIKRGNIATYETREGSPGSSVISLMCKEFNVNETWLRTGEGDMFNKTESSAVERLCSELKASELERQIIQAYFKIEPNIRDSFVRRLIHEVESKRNSDAETTSELAPSIPDKTPDIMSELAEMKRQNKELLTRLEVLEKEEDEWEKEQMEQSVFPTRPHF